MENSKIEWTDHTFNPWTGCEKVSPACANCYAETWAKRCGRDFKTRILTKTWGGPVKWNKQASPEGRGVYYAQHGVYLPEHRPRVFCASLADWLDETVPAEWFVKLLELLHNTRNLDWLLLTKRPQNFLSRMEAALKTHKARVSMQLGCQIANWISGHPWKNVWIGVTTEDQQRADERIPLMFDIPARVRFLSVEPMLGPVELSAFMGECVTPMDVVQKYNFGIDWIICGGESGGKARPMNPVWPSSLQMECEKVGVPFLFKQWGEWGPVAGINPNMPCVRKGKAVVFESGHAVMRLGKKKTGRWLNSRTWDELPLVNSFIEPTPLRAHNAPAPARAGVNPP